MQYRNDVEALDALHAKYRELHQEITKVVYGQDEVVTQVLNTLFSKGHCLLIGVPGLAKTLLVVTIARVLGLKYNRIQFTPDLMPSDIIGTEILDKDRQFRFVQGPIFANVILADEINRTPPKTQSALLEAMQERAVTSAGHHFELEQPFFVLATQNPIEQEGTYPLPEAQLDAAGNFTWAYKYGRRAGENREYVKYVPFSPQTIPPETSARLRRSIPRTMAIIERFMNGDEIINP